MLVLQKRYREQVFLNNHLTKETEKLQGEAKLAREIPQMLCKSVGTCKEIYNDVLSIMQVKMGLLVSPARRKCL